MAKFRDLAIGQTFDFINPDPDKLTQNSFYPRCEKISDRRYRTIGKTVCFYTVVTIDCEVFHVEEH